MEDEPKLKTVNIKDCLKLIFKYTCTIILSVLVVTFIIWGTKVLSYKYMYEDMVKTTIHETMDREFVICHEIHTKEDHTHK